MGIVENDLLQYCCRTIVAVVNDITTAYTVEGVFSKHQNCDQELHKMSSLYHLAWHD